MRDYLSFEPLYQERVWGGRALASVLGRRLPEGGPIGESWEIVDRPEAQSVVASGPGAGGTLREAIARHAAELMGPGWSPARPFPILVKWLDCLERLSLQVHPPAAVAPSLGGEPKTENWYIAEAARGADLIVGLKPGTTPEGFRAAVAAGTLEGCVRKLPVSRGDSVLVRSGEVHAIDAGNLILEIQQNSDTTYRVYDWGRLGLDGKPRQLHLEESMRSIAWQGLGTALVKADRAPAVLAECKEFRIRRVPLEKGQPLEFKAGEEPRLVSVVEGQVGTLGRGSNVLVPYAADVRLESQVASTVLVTDSFTRA